MKSDLCHKNVKRKCKCHKSNFPLSLSIKRLGEESSSVLFKEIAIGNEEKMKCILIWSLILGCGLAPKISALRCASSDGLSVEDVRKGGKGERQAQELLIHFDSLNSCEKVCEKHFT